MKNQALQNSHFAGKRQIHQQETREAHFAFPDSLPCARDVCQTQIPVCTFEKAVLFCSGGFESVFYLFLSRPVHTMRLVLYDSFLFCTIMLKAKK